MDLALGLAGLCSGIDPLISAIQNRRMIKILLAIEEYTELTVLESALKKVGFSVVGISSEFVLTQQILSFNPDVVIASGKGPKLTAVAVGKRLKDMPRWSGHTVLAFPVGFKPAAQDLIKIRMDGFFDMPAEPTKVIPILARMLGFDEKPMLEKLKGQALVSEGAYTDFEPTERKPNQFDIKDDNVLVSGGSKEDTDKGFSIPNAQVAKTSFSLEKSLESEKQNDAFAAPDLKMLENELKVLSGELSPEPANPSAAHTVIQDAISAAVELKNNAEISPPAAPKQSENSSSLTPIANTQWTNQLEQANQKAKERIAKAREALKGVKLNAESSLSRQNTKLAQKDLVLDWDTNELKNQDNLRRQFTQFLFKKKI